MERMTVTHAFTEYEGEGEDQIEIERLKGDHITVTAERADHLRSEGLARSLPKSGKPDEGKADDEDPGTADKA